jgi:hypothetical protein
MFGEVFHAFSKVLGPLANDIVSDDNTEERYAHQRGKHNKINTTIPAGSDRWLNETDFRWNSLFTLLEIPRSVFAYQAVS